MTHKCAELNERSYLKNRMIVSDNIKCLLLDIASTIGNGHETT